MCLALYDLCQSPSESVKGLTEPIRGRGGGGGHTGDIQAYFIFRFKGRKNRSANASSGKDCYGRDLKVCITSVYTYMHFAALYIYKTTSLSGADQTNFHNFAHVSAEKKCWADRPWAPLDALQGPLLKTFL